MLKLKLISYFPQVLKTISLSIFLAVIPINLYANYNVLDSIVNKEFQNRFQLTPPLEVDISQLKKFDEPYQRQEISLAHHTAHQYQLSLMTKLDVYQAVEIALQRHPDISRSIANISSQHAYIDRAKAAYYPQVSGNVASGDIASNKLFDQVVSINANQMLYDFGKVDTSVQIEQAKTKIEQTNLLDSIEDLSQKVLSNIINIKRYTALYQSAQQQIKGMQRISEIAELRAQAGISSQADPIQTQSYLQSAQAYALAQQTQLRLYQQRLNTLLAEDVSHIEWELPEALLTEANLFEDVDVRQLPKMMLANAEFELIKLQQHALKLTTYPTVQLKGELSQALNRRHPTTGEKNGFDSSIAFEANSNFYQGGSTTAQMKALQYAQDAARANLNSVNINIQEQIQIARQEITFKNRQMDILLKRAKTTAHTQDLYEEQYKLGTRTVLDLLNAEQAIHSATQDIENTRYDIFEQLVTYIAATGQAKQVYHFKNQHIQGLRLVP